MPVARMPKNNPLFSLERLFSLSYLILLLCLFVCGCRSATDRQIDKQNIAAKEFNQKRNAIYEAYLTADLNEARNDLLTLAALGENEQQINPRARASFLLRSYGWLYVLESRAGNQQLADVYFQEAKYWKIREKELDGNSDLEIGKMLPSFTKELIVSDVDDWDRGASSGKGPYYLQQLKAANNVVNEK